MRVFVRTIGTSSLVLAAHLASAAGVQHDPQALIALEHSWVRASQVHDVHALGRLLAGDYIDNTYRGTSRTRAEVLAGPRAGASYVSVRFDGLKVRFFGHTGIVTGVNVLRKRDGSATAKIRFTDVFRWQHGAWQVVSSQETLVASR